MSREVGDRSGVAIALISLATICGDQEEYERAGKLFEESLALGRELGKTGCDQQQPDQPGIHQIVRR